MLVLPHVPLGGSACQMMISIGRWQQQRLFKWCKGARGTTKSPGWLLHLEVEEEGLDGRADVPGMLESLTSPAYGRLQGQPNWRRTKKRCRWRGTGDSTEAISGPPSSGYFPSLCWHGLGMCAFPFGGCLLKGPMVRGTNLSFVSISCIWECAPPRKKCSHHASQTEKIRHSTQ